MLSLLYQGHKQLQNNSFKKYNLFSIKKQGVYGASQEWRQLDTKAVVTSLFNPQVHKRSRFTSQHMTHTANLIHCSATTRAINETGGVCLEIYVTAKSTKGFLVLAEAGRRAWVGGGVMSDCWWVCGFRHFQGKRDSGVLTSVRWFCRGYANLWCCALWGMIPESWWQR